MPATFCYPAALKPEGRKPPGVKFLL